MKLSSKISDLFMPSLDWIQVEVSSYCNAQCFYCPNTAYKDMWTNQHLSLDTYKKLLPSFKKTKLAFLQGWGEPLMHPDFFKMVALGKKTGCQVGTTTNGILIDSEVIDRFIQSEIDIVALTLAGLGISNDKFRKGTRFANIVKVIHDLNHEKKRKGATKPAIHVAYMLLRSGLNEIRELPKRFDGLGIDEIVISTLDFVPADNSWNETIRPQKKEEYDEIRAILDEVIQMGKDRGLHIYYQLFFPGTRRLLCSENIHKSLFVSSDGSVSPCVFYKLPIDANAMDKMDLKSRYQEKTFGNINNESLQKIWRKKEYREFRESFYTNRLFKPCQQCPKLYLSQVGN